ncbi:MAG TPA: ATP-binding protein [Ktedonobacteraceae bacterium]|nr:ATP-binding protein [Ktedonobacteraceae bacterium]
MRFKVRSLGGKLILVAALTLLLCMVLFSGLSWSLLKYLSERDARSDASTHLALLKKTYRVQTATLLQDLEQVARSNQLSASITQQPTQNLRIQLNEILALVPIHYHMSLSSLGIYGRQQQLLGQVTASDTNNNQQSPGSLALFNIAMQGHPVSTLQLVSLRDDDWILSIVVPIFSQTKHTPIGVLFADQPIDDAFAQTLVQKTGLNVALCQEEHVLGTTMRRFSFTQLRSNKQLCSPSSVVNNETDGQQHFLTRASSAPADSQWTNSPSLVLVDIEPLYNMNAHIGRSIQILVAMGIFVFALGIIAYTFITRFFFIRPLRRLQARVRTLTAHQESPEVTQRTTDELSMLVRSFNLLSESLHVQESESLARTKQMQDLQIMSDAFISTLDLEHLLGEIVSRLGSITQVKNVSMLLYGREMLSPWAVAQWTNQGQVSNPHLSATSISQQHGAVTVHADPDGDITLAATTKMAAIPVSNTAKRGDSGATRRPQPTSTYGLRRPRIPRPALRDLDLLLARMAMQKKKIIYGEDITTIYRERGDAWSLMALEAGYNYAIAAPLHLQDQSIGVVILYDDKPHQVTSRDTFLLSTAAVQASMAIQNALLFAEVKDKNAALERVNHLKSQFLATVTHELRTPLHSIISYGALILEGFVDGELTSEQEEHIQFMVHRAEDLSHLVDDMLDLSKIEADRLEIKVEPLSIGPCLKEVINQLKPLANNKGLYLSLDMADGLPMVLADSHRIRQIVINLVSNALKFTEQGGVSIRCMPLESYDMLRVSVHDSGIGISPAVLGYIFEAFRQADGSTTRRFGGTGLGLTIARKLIELQGGEVAVESTVGQGSTFSFTLPMLPARVTVT